MLWIIVRALLYSFTNWHTDVKYNLTDEKGNRFTLHLKTTPDIVECNAFMWMSRCNMDVGNVPWGFLLMCEIGCELPKGFAEVVENIAAFHHTFCEMMTRTHSLACSFQGYTHTYKLLDLKQGGAVVMVWDELYSRCRRNGEYWP